MKEPHPNRIKEIRLSKNLTQQQLADLVITGQSQIDRLEKGERKLSVDWMNRVASALQVEPRDLLLAAAGDKAWSLRTIPTRDQMPQDLPVYGTAAGANGDGAFVINMGGQVGTIRRPPGLMGNPGAFAIYVEGDSMEPRYEPGETAIIDPNRPVRPGDDVVIVVANPEPGQPPRAYIKRLVRRGSEQIIVRQFNPEREIGFATREVQAIYRVMRTSELLA